MTRNTALWGVAADLPDRGNAIVRPAAPSGEPDLEALAAEFEALALELEALAGEPVPTTPLIPTALPQALSPSVPSQYARPRDVETATDPVVLPVCGSEVWVTLSEAGAVLEFSAAADGCPILVPIQPGGLESLAHAIAGAIMGEIESA